MKAAVIARAANDLEFFATYFFPHYCEFAWNPFHKEYFNDFVYGQRKIRRAYAAPRGAAKSTMVTLIKTLHDVCYGLENFILILSSTTPLANKKLKDIRNEILTNDLLRECFNLRFPKKKADSCLPALRLRLYFRRPFLLQQGYVSRLWHRHRLEYYTQSESC